jgi:hypothetical protein
MIAAEDNPLEDIRQEHEGFLSQLEGLAVEAIASNDWTIFYAHVTSFQNDRDCEANTKDLTRPGAGSLPNDQLNES